MLSVFSDENYMRQALIEAQAAADADEVPVGAEVVTSGLGDLFPRGLRVGVVLETGSRSQQTAFRGVYQASLCLAHTL